ncbi:MAG: coproporphyrinogen III oxidase, partial [Alphaproteobacteria bacterium]|nr:coproporphyrinogen III oxidase [Alphaproteobacteria bacterium]
MSAFGLYVHWPFCISKCPYCDFNSHVAAAIDQARWRAALLAELDHFARRTAGRELGSVFFGGGTPSLMEPATVAALLDRAASHWTIAPDCEITLEANPGTVDQAKFEGFRAAGVGRVSLGMQAMADDALRFLGRRHDSSEARRAVALARRLFPRMSFDLIYARPGQTPAAWAAELGAAIELAADHLSLYQLTIEPGTAFHPAQARGDFVLPDEEDSVAMFETTREICEAAGLPSYEVSNHARPGAECRHNLLYWEGGDYAGIGPGAHGRLTLDGTTWATRQRRAPASWLDAVERQGHATRESTALDPVERARERALMGLRLTRGIPLSTIAPAVDR